MTIIARFVDCLVACAIRGKEMQEMHWSHGSAVTAPANGVAVCSS
jgi:hypothetical protein